MLLDGHALPDALHLPEVDLSNSDANGIGVIQLPDHPAPGVDDD